jgi:hypothetical protein
MNVDLKTGLLLASLLMGGAGFYYNTQSRLDNLEAKIAELDKKVAKFARSSKKNKRKK